MRSMQNFYTAPVNDGEMYLEPNRGLWSIVRPYNKDTTNRVLNPSFESGASTFWHDYAGDANSTLSVVFVLLAESTHDYAYSGKYSLLVSQNASDLPYGVEYFPSNDDASLLTIPIGADGANTYISAYVKACAGDTIQLIGTYDGVLAPTVPDFIPRTTTVTATGVWQRVQVYVTNQRPAQAIVGIIVRVIPAAGSACSSFMLDAVMATDVAMNDYFDGDTEGAVWNGTPFLSQSTLSRFSRLFGEEIFLNDIGFHITGWQGAGMAAINNDTIPYGQGGGSYYNRTWPSQQRGLTLSGTIDSDRSYRDMQKRHSRLLELVGLHRFAVDPQPFMLRYRLTQCNCDTSGVLELPVVYFAGLEGAVTNLFSEQISLQLNAYEEQFWRSTRVKSRLLADNSQIVICYDGTAPTPMRIFAEGNTVDAADVELISVRNHDLHSGIYMNSPPNPGYQTVAEENYLIIGDLDKICGQAYLQDKSTGDLINVTGNIIRPDSLPSEFVLLHGNNHIAINFNVQPGIIPRVFVSYRERFLSSSDAWRLPAAQNCGPTFDPQFFGDRCL